ncbi:MAG: CDP-diacylglycerol--glycerol-3-phosphate 3-phosphatidyltransferase [Lachnospiraceae bacterium]|nr:CDP-diacylglycerol--glycerol-3-phosphate 3-phosphatidyltransferase [Lachnospiraceae bacterium]MDE7029496.1 CDP-diacylglycerol--glycerol-3-phosphate 3-phosphatidyltransferase [Lachnospiraceae bacterium]
MNLPNKLTVFRVILIVPFVLILLGSHAQWAWFMAVAGGIAAYSDYIALAIFIIASLTDLLDGKIARKYNLVTNFGKFMDPLADKLLVCAALICLIELGRIPAWIVIIIISREFIISGFRLVAADNRVVIAANYWGKFKTTFQMIMVCLMIVNIDALALITQIVMWIAVVLTVVSLVDYVVKNKGVLLDGKDL